MSNFSRRLVLVAACALTLHAEAYAQSAFNHQIQLKLPKGVAGMQPELALAYDSGVGNGMLGVGWGLAGLSQIDRVNYGNGINYGGADTYAHSELGVLVRQSDGTYRSKRESFVRLQQTGGTCGDGPCAWVATDPNGVKFYYGTDVGSRLPGPNGSVRMWGLTQVVDLHGNSYEVAYLSNSASLYPSSITYTRGPGITRLRTVEFGYETRPDVEHSYVQGLRQRFELRLAVVRVKAAGALLRKYDIAYRQSAGTGRSLVSSVKECGSDGDGAYPTCFPAHTFDWADTFEYPSPETWAVTHNWGDGAHTVVGDFDGDGRTDFATANGGTIHVKLARETVGDDGAVSFRYVEASAPWVTSGSFGDYLLVGDINGDGRADLVSPAGTTFHVYYSSGSSFTKQTISGLVNSLGREAQIVDVNADGKPELLSFEYKRLVVTTINPAAGTASQTLWGTYGDWPATAAKKLPGDFNGDGKTDLAMLVAVPCTSTTGDAYHTEIIYHWDTVCGYTGEVHTYYSTGAAFSEAVSTITGGTKGNLAYVWAADFNGDGKTDIASRASGALAMALSTGIGFELQTWPLSPTWTGEVATSGSFNSWGGPEYTWVGDFNGDGKADVVTYSDPSGTADETLYRFMSGGTGFRGLAVHTELTYAYRELIRTVDIDGDGKLDLAGPVVLPGIRVWRGPRSTKGAPGAAGWSETGKRRWILPASDLLYLVNNGLGGSAQIVYAPAPQVAGAVQASPQTPGLHGIPEASPDPVVVQTAAKDGYRTLWTYHYYHDRRFLPGTVPNQRDLGFQRITTEDGQTRSRTTTYYRQDPPFEGRVERSEVATPRTLTPLGEYALVSRSNNFYDRVIPASGTELVRHTQTISEAFELGQPAFMQMETTAYDEFGYPVVKSQLATSLPTVVTTTVYSHDTSRWVLGRILRVTTTAAPEGKTLGDVKNVWTGDDITSKQNWLDTNGSWLTTTMTYDANGNVETVTEPGSGTRVTRTAYDAGYRAYPVRVTNALNQSVARGYNDDGLVTSVTDANGATTTTEYDVLGRPRRESRPDGGSTVYRYEDYGNLALQRNTTEATTGSGVIVTSAYFDGANSTYLIRTTQEDGRQICKRTEKDSAGRVSKVSLPYYCSETSIPWTVTTFDTSGRAASQTAPDGTTTAYQYGPDHERTIDANGRARTKYIDSRKRVVRIEDGRGKSTLYGYDELGRLVRVTLPSGEVTAMTYDSLNRRTSISAPQTGGDNLGFTYDGLGRKETAAFWQQGDTPVARYFYDDTAGRGIGRLTRLEDASGITRYAYDVMGRVASVTKEVQGKSFTHSSTYDQAGRLTRIVYPDGSTVEYRYVGNDLTAVLLDGQTLASYENFTAGGRAQLVTYGNGVTTTFSYDLLGRLTQLDTKPATSGQPDLQSLAYCWTDQGNCGSAQGLPVQDMNGVTIAAILDQRPDKVVAGVNTDETQRYEYDDEYRLTRATGVWGDKSFVYDDVGNLASYGGLTQRALAYDGQQVVSGTGLADVRYDSAGNMLHRVLDGAASDYEWTLDGRLAAVTRNGVRTEMGYDIDGNRFRKVFHRPGGLDVTTLYVGNTYERRTYSDGSPERHTINVMANGQILVSVTKAGSVVTAYNERQGWRTDLAAGLAYDGSTFKGAALKLASFAKALAGHPKTMPVLILSAFAIFAAYVLAGLWRSLRATRYAGPSRAFRLAGAVSVLLFAFTGCGRPDGASAITSSAEVLIGDTTLGPPPGTLYYHRNYVNSSSVVTDSSGVERSRIVYLPFGEISNEHSVGEDVVTSKFTGQELDEETSLYYYRARFYDPALGRMISADSVVPSANDLQSYNRYAYARNNPVIYTDPSGHSFWSDLGDAFGDALRAISNAVAWLGKTIWSGIKDVARFIGKALDKLWRGIEGIVSNPVALLMFAAGALLAALGQPGAFVLWAKATAFSMSAIAVAQAAGVQNPVVLGLIGAIAGAYGAAAGWGNARDYIRGLSKWGVSRLLSKLEGRYAQYLSIANAFAADIIVNATGEFLTTLIAGRDITSDPNVQKALQAAQRHLATKMKYVDISKVDVRTGGLWGWAYKTLFDAQGGAAGNTINIRDALSRSEIDLNSLVTHELTHAFQYQVSAFGLDFAAAYVGQLFKHGYYGNTFEVEADREYGSYRTCYASGGCR